MPAKKRFVPILACLAALAILSAAPSLASYTGPAGDPAAGAEIYKEKCAGCHGKGGKGGFAPSHVGCDMCNDYGALVTKIEKTMPKGKAKECQGQCAADTAAYIFIDLNGNSF